MSSSYNILMYLTGVFPFLTTVFTITNIYLVTLVTSYFAGYRLHSGSEITLLIFTNKQMKYNKQWFCWSGTLNTVCELLLL